MLRNRAARVIWAVVALMVPILSCRYVAFAPVQRDNPQDPGAATVALPVLAFNAVPGDTRVVLTWQYAATGAAAGAVVLVRTDSYPAGPSDGTEVYRGAETTAAHEGLTAGTTYYYTAYAYDASGRFARGMQAVATPGSADENPPGDVSGFSATGGSAQVALQWANPADEDFGGVRIMFRTDTYPTGPSDGSEVYQGRAMAHTHTGLVDGTTYYYTAFAYDGVPNYSAGATAVATPGSTDTTPPADVSGFAATVEEGRILLGWTNPADTDFAGVRIVTKADGAPTGPTDGTELYSGTGTSFVHEPVTGGTSYYYGAYSFDGIPNYSAGAQTSATALLLYGPGLSSWSAGPAMPELRAEAGGFAYNGYLYAIGGHGGGSERYVTAVYAPIGTDGSLGAWSYTTSLATGRIDFPALANGGYAYVFGGNTTGVLLGDTQVAPINGDGTLGAWTATASFSPIREGHAAVASGGYLYITGGWSNAMENRSDVLSAAVQPDGTLGAWTATTSISTGRFRHGSVAWNGKIYVIGGMREVSGTYTFLADVQFAAPNPDGTMTTWTATTPMPGARLFFTAAVVDGYLYVVGGTSGSDTYLDSVLSARILPDGTLDSWSAAPSLPLPRAIHSGSVFQNHLYFAGGYAGGVYTSDSGYATLLPR